MSFTHTLTALDIYLKQEFKAPARSLAWRVRSLFSGHPSQSLMMLSDDARRRRDYIPLFRSTRRVLAQNSRLIAFLHNKIGQKLWLDAMMPKVAPPLKFYIAGRQLVPISGRTERQNLDTLLAFAEAKGRIFLKPPDQDRGKGAMRIEFTGGQFAVNGEPTEAGALLNELSAGRYSGYTVSEFIEQGEWSAAFYPRTLNTLRVLTGTSPVRHEPILLAATLRIGRPSTFPVDNWDAGRGGVAALIEPATGVLTSGLIFNQETKRREWCENHPDTGTRIKDAEVPDWKTVAATVRELAGLLPFPGLIGWDIALTSSGPVVVEANHLPGLDNHQCHRSLKSTPEQRAFWAEMGL